MTFRLASLLLMAALVTACGDRIPPEVTLKTDMFLGTWVKESDLKANLEAEDGGKATITVLSVQSNLEVWEEVRVPGEKELPDAYPVGRLLVTMKKGEGTIEFHEAKLKAQREKITATAKRSDADIAGLTKAKFDFLVSPNRTSSNVVRKETVAGVEKNIKIDPYVKISSEDRQKLKLKPAPAVPKPPENKKEETPAPVVAK